MQSEIFIKILLTIVFGAILGLETETREIEKKGKEVALKQEKGRIGGVRTYTVLSLFGGITGLFYLENQIGVVYILMVAMILFTLAAYVLNVQIKHAFGLTTEIAIIITFVLGFLTTSNILPITLVLVILVLLTFFLSQKRGIGFLIQKIEHKEIIDIIRFGLVSIVILPILPNQDFFLSDVVKLFSNASIDLGSFKNFVLINPFQVWFIVVLISGLNLLGYILSRIFGKTKGLFAIGIFGGLISSTSTTITLAHKAKSDPKGEDNTNLYAGIALIANAISFVELFILLLVSSKTLFFRTLYINITVLVIGTIVGIFFIYRHHHLFDGKKHHDIKISYEPFSVTPAIKFVAMIILIKLGIQFIELTPLNNLFIPLTALSGATGTSAPTIAIAGLIDIAAITLSAGFITYLLLNVVNFLAKIFFSYFQGTRQFAGKVTIGLVITSLAGIIALVVTSNR